MPDSDRPESSRSSMGAGALPLTPLWDLGSLMEIQAHLWNQMLDSQRNLWAVCMPWLQSSPWLQASAEAIEAEEAGKEPAETVDGIPDALELQVRTWNHFLDANRSFWTSFGWPMALAGAPLESAQPSAGDAELSRAHAAHAGRSHEGAKGSRATASGPKAGRAARKH